MISSKQDQSYLDLKTSDWELDFYSRPIIEKNGKKRWELIISSTKNFNSPEIFFWSKICPANTVNSIWLTSALEEALKAAENKGWSKRVICQPARPPHTRGTSQPTGARRVPPSEAAVAWP